MKELRLDARLEAMEEVQQFVTRGLEEAEASPKICFQMEIAVEELYVNIAHYAYGGDVGIAVIRYELLEYDGSPAVRVDFMDQGVPFDPLAKEDADVTLSADERKIGGLGIYMVKKSMDHMEYCYQDGWNQTSIWKKIK